MTEQKKSSVLIRADSGGTLGSGHFMRMIALAQALSERGIDAVFASAQYHNSMLKRIELEGFVHRKLIDCELGNKSDANQTKTLAREYGCQWVFLDGYHFGLEYQRQLHKAGYKVAVMEDNGHCKVWCADLIINQNFGAFNKSYENEISDGVALTGPSYALLRREFREVRSLTKSCKWPPQRILITFGGADPGNATGLVLEGLEQTKCNILDLKVLIGGVNPHLQALSELASDSRHNVEILTDVQDMPSMFLWSDAVISAGGSTCYEWLLFGLPACVLTIADNQEPIVQALSEAKIATSLGRMEALRPKRIAGFLDCWMQEGKMTSASYNLDAHGALRIAAFLDAQLIICIATSESSWINPYTKTFVQELRAEGHEVMWVHDATDAPPADILFLLSYWELVPLDVRRRFAHVLVVHESNLPKGRGWSPVTWQVIEGKNEIPVCLLEAIDAVDAGPVYMRSQMQLNGHELVDEIRKEQAHVTFHLCRYFLEQYPAISSMGVKQVGSASVYPRRRPEDSEIDPDKTIREQFNLLRVADNKSYPVIFNLDDSVYTIRIDLKK